MSRLDEVISKYAVMQDKSEERERQKRRARVSQGPSHSPKASLDSGEVWKGCALQETLSSPCTGHQGSQGSCWGQVQKK